MYFEPFINGHSDRWWGPFLSITKIRVWSFLTYIRIYIYIYIHVAQLWGWEYTKARRHIDTQSYFKAGFVSLIKVPSTSKDILSLDCIALCRFSSKSVYEVKLHNSFLPFHFSWLFVCQICKCCRGNFAYDDNMRMPSRKCIVVIFRFS